MAVISLLARLFKRKPSPRKQPAKRRRRPRDTADSVAQPSSDQGIVASHLYDNDTSRHASSSSCSSRDHSSYGDSSSSSDSGSSDSGGGGDSGSCD